MPRSLLSLAILTSVVACSQVSPPRIETIEATDEKPSVSAIQDDNEVFAAMRKPHPNIARLFADPSDAKRTDLKSYMKIHLKRRAALGGPAYVNLLLHAKRAEFQTNKSLHPFFTHVAGFGHGDTIRIRMTQKLFDAHAAKVGLERFSVIPPQFKMKVSIDEPTQWQRRKDDRLGYVLGFHGGVSITEAKNYVAKYADFSRAKFPPGKAFPYGRSIHIDLNETELKALAEQDVVLRIDPTPPPERAKND